MEPVKVSMAIYDRRNGEYRAVGEGHEFVAADPADAIVGLLKVLMGKGVLRLPFKIVMPPAGTADVVDFAHIVPPKNT